MEAELRSWVETLGTKPNDIQQWLCLTDLWYNCQYCQYPRLFHLTLRLCDADRHLMAEITRRNEFLMVCEKYIDGFVPRCQLSRMIIDLHQLLKTDSVRLVFENASRHNATKAFNVTIKEATGPSTVQSTSVVVNLKLLDTEVQNVAELVGFFLTYLTLLTRSIEQNEINPSSASSDVFCLLRKCKRVVSDKSHEPQFCKQKNGPFWFLSFWFTFIWFFWFLPAKVKKQRQVSFKAYKHFDAIFIADDHSR